METASKAMTILIVDDDDDDRHLINRAFVELHSQARVMHVRDGQEMIDYMHRNVPFSDPSSFPLPNLILLDLNMPRMNGQEALQYLKSDPRLRRIPVVILSTSDSQTDVQLLYDLGANAYVRKPLSYHGLLRAVQRLDQFWLQVVRFPQMRYS